MPRETLRLLEQDLKRILMAGSSLAASNGELHRHQQSLTALASKVPVLGKVAEQVGKVLAASPKQASSELLNLSAVLMQLRAIQANPIAPDEKLREAPRVEPLDTPIAPAQIDLIWKALQGQSKNRSGVISDAIEQKQIRDLRLLRPWIDLLDDSEWGDQVIEEVLPVLGKAAIAPLYQTFSLPGKVGDSRRLHGLVKLNGLTVEPLVMEALENGSVELREAAIEALGALNPKALLARATGLLKDRVAGVRCAVIVAISKHPGDENLALLISALIDDERIVSAAAKQALPTFAHPERNATILALLTPALLSIKAPSHAEVRKDFTEKEAQKIAAAAKKPGAKGAKAAPKKVAAKKGAAKKLQLTPAEQKEFNKRQKEYDTKFRYAAGLIELIGECQVKEATPLLLPIFQEPKHIFAEITTQTLLMLGDPKAMLEVAKRLDTVKGDDITAPLDAVFKMPPAQTYDTLAKYFEPKRLAEKGGDLVAIAILGRFTQDSWPALLEEEEYKKQYLAEPRWADLVSKMLEHPRLNYSAFSALLYTASAWQEISPEDFYKRIEHCLNIEKIESEAFGLTASIVDALEYSYEDQAKLFTLPAWADYLALVVSSKNKNLNGARVIATEELVERDDPRAVPGLLRMLDATSQPWNLFELLDKFKDPLIAPALLKKVQGKHKLNLASVYEVIRRQQDKTVLPTLQKMLLKKKRGKEADEIKKTIKDLEG
jgi:HEAT repeat protein